MPGIGEIPGEICSFSPDSPQTDNSLYGQGSHVLVQGSSDKGQRSGHSECVDLHRTDGSAHYAQGISADTLLWIASDQDVQEVG